MNANELHDLTMKKYEDVIKELEKNIYDVAANGSWSYSYMTDNIHTDIIETVKIWLDEHNVAYEVYPHRIVINWKAPHKSQDFGMPFLGNMFYDNGVPCSYYTTTTANTNMIID